MANEPEQGALFEMDPWWKDHWRGMPDFTQNDLSAVKRLIVNFASEDDLAAFAELIGQTVTRETCSVWYPAAEIGHFVNKGFVDAPSDPAPPASEEPWL